MNVEYAIHPVKTSKDQIKNPKLADEGVIPSLNSSVIITGKSGSGKSVLLHNLLTRKEFYNKYEYFDKIFIISPTAEQDDIQKGLNIPDSCVFTDLEEATQVIKKLEDHQTKQIKEKGSAKASKFCLILDDCVGHQKFMNSKEFTNLFIKSRHYNITVFFLTQHFNRLPKICRLQASYLVFFAISNAEAESIAESFSPPNITKKNFLKLIDDVLREPFQFLCINMRAPWETRFRRGLGMPISLDLYKTC